MILVLRLHKVLRRTGLPTAPLEKRLILFSYVTDMGHTYRDQLSNSFVFHTDIMKRGINLTPEHTVRMTLIQAPAET